MKLSNLLLALATGALFVSAAPTPMQVDQLVKTLASRSNTSSTSPGTISIPFKKHKRSKPSGNVSKRDGHQVELIDVGDLAYLAEIDIGTPAQRVSLHLDTGSAQLFVDSLEYFSSNNTFYHSSEPHGQGFDSSKSSTFVSLPVNQTVNVYGDTTVFVADVVQDTISFGGYEVENANFALVKKGNVSTEAGNGIFGLGWTSETTQQNFGSFTVPFLEQLWHSGALQNPLFSFNLWSQQYNPIYQGADLINDNIVDSTPGGQLLLGDVDSTLFEGEIAYTELVTDNIFSSSYPSRWKTTIQGVSVNGNLLPNSQFDATFDTGATTSLLSEELLSSIFSQLDPKYQVSTVLEGGSLVWTFQCPDDFEPFTVSLTFGSQQFDLPFANLLDGGRFGDTCIFSPQSFVGDATNGFIIGDDILRSLYTVYRFDPPSIGLAKLSTKVTGTENPQPSNFKDIPVATISFPLPAGTPTSPILFTPFPSATPTTLTPAYASNYYWDPATYTFASDPIILQTDAPIPSPTFTSQRKSNGGSSNQSGSNGEKSGSEKTSPFSFSVAVGMTLLSFVFSSALL